ncbi:arylacetamide deacetylase-like 4 [Zootoca vivipara]|uniref:arylacetamide deacetylase-like 4 n=1 Tax=Zootoca vivipara TaxID=8524 RepID=UPI00293BD835|nr:arylacetamide deacetylase-like 4 [Zootoca vivipara]
MELLQSLLLGLIGVIGIPSLFLLSWVIYYDLSRSKIPSGFDSPLKLRGLHCSNQEFCLLYVDDILYACKTDKLKGLLSNCQALLTEKLGICHLHETLRILIEGIPPKKNSRLIIKDLVFDEVPVRLYCLNSPLSENRRGIVYLHGGIGVLGSIRSSERFSRCLALESDSVVVSVGFRLAPEHLFPVAIQDCCTAATHFLKNAKEYGVDPSRIVIGGDSSGGTFAAAVCQILVARKDIPRVRAQFLIYPFLQAVDFNLPSHQQNHSVILFFNKWAIRLATQFFTGKRAQDVDGILKGSHVPDDMWVKYRKWICADNIPEEFKVRGYRPIGRAPFSEKLYEASRSGLEAMFSPLIAEDCVIQELPETFILTCEYCPYRDDGLLYKKRLEDNGVQVTWHHIPDGFHGILLLFGQGPLEFPSSRAFMQHLINFLERF